LPPLAKILLLGIVWYSAIMPLFLAGSRAPKRALRNVYILSIVGIIFWSYLALVKYPVYAPLWEQHPN
jgi:uncharacterized membrane protein